MKYELRRPCPECPFRTDVKPYLRRARIREIERGLVRGEFACHQTTVPCDDGSDREATEDSQHCAGALILLEKLDRPSQMMRICERLGFYDRRKLDMEAPVFDDFDSMAEAQSR